jgi:serine/threonine protein kinase
MKGEKYINEKYDYINTNPIHFGNRGLTYRIKDKKVQSEYILKKLEKKMENENFDSGIDFLKKLKGTNIVNFIDYTIDENGKYYYIVLEQMEGSLDSMLRKEFPNGMPSKLIRKIFSQVNTGLKVMRKLGMNHKGLNPAKILYSYTTEEKTDFIIKLADFGLATGNYIEENDYIAPELKKKNKNNINYEKCDLYSLGVILFKLKTGQFIFDGEDDLEKLLNQKSDKFRSDTDDQKLNDLIKKLVVYEPDKRMKWEDYFEDKFFKEIDNDTSK